MEVQLEERRLQVEEVGGELEERTARLTLAAQAADQRAAAHQDKAAALAQQVEWVEAELEAKRGEVTALAMRAAEAEAVRTARVPAPLSAPTHWACTSLPCTMLEHIPLPCEYTPCPVKCEDTPFPVKTPPSHVL